MVNLLFIFGDHFDKTVDNSPKPWKKTFLTSQNFRQVCLSEDMNLQKASLEIYLMKYSKNKKIPCNLSLKK